MSWGDDALKIARDNPEVILPPEAIEYLAGKGKRKGNKFNAVRCEFQGMKFDSKAEMARYGDLRLLELNGHISDLETQPVFVLTAGVKYKGDFRYIEAGKVIVEDVKGGKATQTRVFLNKWKQVKVLYPDVEFRLIER
jgi:hypothetical protein